MRSGASLLLFLSAAAFFPLSGSCQTSSWIDGEDPDSIRSLQLHGSDLTEVKDRTAVRQ